MFLHTIYIIDNIESFCSKTGLHKLKILPVTFQVQNLQSETDHNSLKTEFFNMQKKKKEKKKTAKHNGIWNSFFLSLCNS